MVNKATTVEREFIIQQFIDMVIPIRIHGAGKTVLCKLIAFEEGQLCFLMSISAANMFSKKERITAYAEFHGQPLCFSSKVIKSDDARLYTEVPSILIKWPQRSDVRVSKPDNCSMEIYLNIGKIPLNFPRHGEYTNVQKPETDASFDSTSFENLIIGFKEKIMNYCDEFRIIMFRDYKPVKFEEKLLIKYGKALYIPSISEGLPDTDPYPEGRFITKIMEQQYEGASLFKEESIFENLLKEKNEAGYYAELWCPVLYFQYVIGYIYMGINTMGKKFLDDNQLDYVWDFSKFLAYFLKGTNYFGENGDLKPMPFGVEIVDISVTGCQITIPKKILGLSIKKDTKIKIQLDYQNDVIVLTGIAIRKFGDSENESYGIAFLELSNTEKEKLYNILYSRPYNPNTLMENESSFPINTIKQ